ncbi:MAG: hypothetical protein R2751_13755 [Bacteroidales bacterium]
MNKWDVGFLDMQTQSLDTVPSENFGVARVRRQVFNANSYVGAIMTSRLGADGTYNLAYGADGIFRVFGDDYLDVRVAQTLKREARTRCSHRIPPTPGSIGSGDGTKGLPTTWPTTSLEPR